MAYDEKLADRVRAIIARSQSDIEEKKMFGGLCFMVNEKMCVGVEKERLMIRLDPDTGDQLMERPGVHPMDFTGKPMRGYLFVDTDVLSKQKDLEFWIEQALAYNKVAKKSAKRKKS